THSLEAIVAQTQILDRYSGLLSRWLKRLAAKGILMQQEDCFTSLHPLPTISLETLKTEAKAILTDTAPIMDYVERCGTKIVPILTGRENPLETLFPEGSYNTVDYLYHDWSLIRYFNGILRTIMEELTRQFQSYRKIQILEIGAGTGGATAAVLPSLPVDRTEYDFTDMSDFFLVRAQEKFKDYPFVRYGILNIEQAVEAQGFGGHHYDVVIAANALHATRDLEQTLANARELLASGGFLLLFEGTNYLSWFDITTSLIEGWERFDDGLRGETPLLSGDQWQNVLKTSGFEKVAVFPQDPSLAELFAHHVILAQLPESDDYSDNGNAESGYKQPPNRLSEGMEAVKIDFIEQLTNALPEDRQDLLINYVREHVTKILRLEASFLLGRKDRLMDAGLDSLMAVELRSRLNKGLKPKRALSATLVFDYPTIETIANYLEIELFGAIDTNATNEGTAPAATGVVQSEVEIRDLSDDEVEALLLRKLDDEK
ncbi:MAG: methyltransferase, partial [Anaerolineales bacterium]